MIYNYSNDFSSAFYKADENVFEVFIDEEKYIWRYNNLHTELEIYEGKWVSCGNDLPQLIQRFASIHHGKKFMKEFTAGDIYVNIPSGDYTCIKAENIKIDIIFYAIPKEEKITAMIRKNDKTYTYNYNRLSRYYTYQVLADPKGTINDIITDIQLDMKFMGF